MFFLFVTTYVIMIMTTRITVIIGVNEHPALYPNMHALLTYGKGITVLIAARTNPIITM